MWIYCDLYWLNSLIISSVDNRVWDSLLLGEIINLYLMFSFRVYKMPLVLVNHFNNTRSWIVHATTHCYSFTKYGYLNNLNSMFFIFYFSHTILSVAQSDNRIKSTANAWLTLSKWATKYVSSLHGDTEWTKFKNSRTLRCV